MNILKDLKTRGSKFGTLRCSKENFEDPEMGALKNLINFEKKKNFHKIEMVSFFYNI